MFAYLIERYSQLRGATIGPSHFMWKFATKIPNSFDEKKKTECKRFDF